MNIEALMEQVQEFASSWSLVGGRFDDGSMLEQANEAKECIRNALTEQAETMAAIHAGEIKAYEGVERQLNIDVANLNERIRQLKASAEADANTYKATIFAQQNQLEAERVPDADWLSNVIRHADGSHTLGAIQLAEKIIDAMLAAVPQQKKEGE